MLVLQILSAALTISLAKANPVAIDVRTWQKPAADGAFEREELIIASPASHYSQYIPGPTETSLTLRYHQERATCLDQFVWYCQIPAGACIAAVGSIVCILFYSLYYCSNKSFRPRLSISGLFYLAPSPLFVHRYVRKVR